MQFALISVMASALAGCRRGATDTPAQHREPQGFDAHKSGPRFNAEQVTPEERERKDPQLKDYVTLSQDKPNILRRTVVNPPRDKDDRKPRDVVIAFFKDDGRGDMESARAWWFDDKPRYRVENPIGFEAYYKKLRAFDRVEVGFPGMGKDPYSLVYFKTYKNGQIVWAGGFYALALVEGRWKIARGIVW